jgi:hypothetical protein
LIMCQGGGGEREFVGDGGEAAESALAPVVSLYSTKLDPALVDSARQDERNRKSFFEFIGRTIDFDCALLALAAQWHGGRLTEMAAGGRRHESHHWPHHRPQPSGWAR